MTNQPILTREQKDHLHLLQIKAWGLGFDSLEITPTKYLELINEDGIKPSKIRVSMFYPLEE